MQLKRNDDYTMKKLLLLLICSILLLNGCSNSNSIEKKETNKVKISNEHRNILEKLQLKVPETAFIGSYYEGYSFKCDIGYVTVVTDKNEIRYIYVHHSKCPSLAPNNQFELVKEGKILSNYQEGLNKHLLEENKIAKQNEEKKKEEIRQREKLLQEQQQKEIEEEKRIQENANDLGCSISDYRLHFGPMLSEGFDRAKMKVWYNDSSSVSINQYGSFTQYGLHLVGKGQNGNRVYVNVYEYSNRPGQYQVSIMTTSHQ